MLTCLNIKNFILSGIIGLVIGFASSQILVSSENNEHVDDHMMTMEPVHDHNEIGVLHSHEKAVVTGGSLTPSVTLEAIRDTKDGYNIWINTKNYTFTPETVNELNVQNEGHAHIYVNGEKVARVYGNWFHLSEKYLSKETNQVRVTLNANDHGEWSVGDTSIESIISITQ
jgi:hypothetical protein